MFVFAMANRYEDGKCTSRKHLIFKCLFVVISLSVLVTGCGRQSGSRSGNAGIDTEMGNPCWSKDSKALYYRKIHSEAGTSEVWRYDIKTKTKKKYPYTVPHETGDIDISPDGKSIVYQFIHEEKPVHCLETLDLATGKIKRVYETKKDLYGVHWLPQNRIASWEESDESGSLIMIEPDSMSKVNVNTIVRPVYLSKDGDGFVSFYEGEDFFYYSLKNKKHTSLGVRDVSRVLYLSRHQMVYYNHSQQIVSLDIHTLHKTLISLPRVSADAQLSPDLRHYYYIPMSRGDWGPLPGLFVMEVPASERQKLLNIECARKPSSQRPSQASIEHENGE